MAHPLRSERQLGINRSAMPRHSMANQGIALGPTPTATTAPARRTSHGGPVSTQAAPETGLLDQDQPTCTSVPGMTGLACDRQGRNRQIAIRGTYPPAPGTHRRCLPGSGCQLSVDANPVGCRIHAAPFGPLRSAATERRPGHHCTAMGELHLTPNLRPRRSSDTDQYPTAPQAEA